MVMIDEFSKLVREAKAGEKTSVESAPFYTEKYGYKLNVRILPNGSQAAKGKYLSVYICVMGGQYDAILPWPFKRKVKFTLIDQQEDTDKRENVFEEIIPDNDPNSYARPKTQYNSSAHGVPSFISQTKLESRRYVVNDTLHSS
ncbi:TNF receptor-associated factor 1-like [Stylophora pistillata]|uniref:TNF receptor-associated factor 1-like n=1 Tax=Stylophora pistillata TaxID=50429 RepID=UPI000C04B676|nr:TNF receptor-associated factor 1-like [Stylophora pistillata]